MNPIERDEVMRRLLGAWPTPKMPDEQRAVWADHLNDMDRKAALDVLRRLETTSTHRPSLAAFHEAYEVVHPRAQRHSTPQHVCGVCEDGWVEVRCNTEAHDCTCDEYFDINGVCPLGGHTYKRCPNGCVPMTHGEREEHGRIQAMHERSRPLGHRPDFDAMRATIAEAGKAMGKRRKEMSPPPRHEEEVF